MSNQYVSIKECEVNLKGRILSVSKELYDLQELTFVYFQCNKNYLYKFLILSTNDKLQQICYSKIGNYCAVGCNMYKSIWDVRYKLLWIE